MPLLTATNLTKTYRVYQKKTGLMGAIKGLYRREHKEVKAVDDVSFSVEPGEPPATAYSRMFAPELGGDIVEIPTTPAKMVGTVRLLATVTSTPWLVQVTWTDVTVDLPLRSFWALVVVATVVTDATFSVAGSHGVPTPSSWLTFCAAESAEASALTDSWREMA